MRDFYQKFRSVKFAAKCKQRILLEEEKSEIRTKMGVGEETSNSKDSGNA